MARYELNLSFLVPFPSVIRHFLTLNRCHPSFLLFPFFLTYYRENLKQGEREKLDEIEQRVK